MPTLDKNFKVFVVGSISNTENTLPDVVETISSAICFGEVSWFFVESMSVDKTPEVLTELREIHPNFDFVQLEQDPDANRIQRITEARNTYLEWIRRNSRFPDLVIVVDGDIILERLALESILKFWESGDLCWSASAHPAYYDIMALRVPNTVEKDYRLDVMKDIASGVGIVQSYYHRLFSRQEKIGKLGDLQVRSAFGGLAIYRGLPVRNSNAIYRTAVLDVGFECEHVAFHYELAKEFPGGLKIDPEIVVSNPGHFSFLGSPKFHPWIRLVIIIESSFPPFIRRRLSIFIFTLLRNRWES